MSGFGTREVAVPPKVRAMAGAAEPVRVVWQNEGGVTCEVGEGESRRFVKWAPAGHVDLSREAARMRWAGAYVNVPVVVDHGSDADGTWMVTLPIEGESAVSARWKADPATATRAIGEGLRAFHDALAVADCPFSWSIEDRIRAVEANPTDPGTWHRVHQHLTFAEALEIARQPPPIDLIVVCHGDTCAPNTIIDDGGRFAGHVDLGSLGVADRWADLAVATWSTEWNYGPEWEPAVLHAYGIEPDPERTEYYRLLYDLSPL